MQDNMIDDEILMVSPRPRQRSFRQAMWKQLVDEILVVEGYSERRLANELVVSRDTVRRMRRGKTMNPRYNIGAKLFAVHLLRRPDRYGQQPVAEEVYDRISEKYITAESTCSE